MGFVPLRVQQADFENCQAHADIKMTFAVEERFAKQILNQNFILFESVSTELITSFAENGKKQTLHNYLSLVYCLLSFAHSVHATCL